MTSRPAITVTNVSNTVVTEGGGATYTYTVVLDTAPTSDVTITLNSETQLSTNVTSLTFTTANWNVAQTVTVTVIDDTVGEGNHTGVITSTVTSTDTSYNGLTVAPVQVTITDNDLPTSPREYTAQTGTANPFNGIDIGDNSTPTLAALDGATPLNAQAEAVWDQALSNARDHLTNLLSDLNRDAILADVFGRAGTDPATFEANKQTLLATLGGDGLQIDIDLRSDGELGGAFAAYAAVSHTGLERIYMNADKLNNGLLDVNLATSALLEEFGHALDWRLNGAADSPGDEGQLFAAEVSGVVLTADQRALIDAEDDTAVLTIEGVQVWVEQATFTATTGTDNSVLSTGADTVTVTNTTQINSTDIFNGGAGTDTIVIGVLDAGVSVALSAAATNGSAGFLSFEAIQFLNTSGTSTATFAAGQFGSGKIELTSSFIGTASSQGVAINLAAAGSFDASGFSFTTWTSGTDSFSLNGSTGTETIVGSSQADSIIGAAGNDNLSGGNGNDTIDGGTGNDRMSGGAGVDFFITSAVGGSSTAATSNSLAATISGSSVDNLIFDNGVDIITDFVVGTDILSGRNTQTLINLVGQSSTLDLTANRGYYAYGEWDGRRFLFRSNWASSRYNDLIFVVGDSGTLTPITSTGYTILTDISGSIDTIAPTITSFSTTTANGSYKAGDSINITATASEAILAGGQITVTLNAGTGATVTLTAATTGSTLTGTYTIAADQNSADLTVNSFSIGTGSATPRDAAFGNALTSTTVPSGVNNIAGSYAIVVDTLAPSAPSISSVTDDVGTITGTLTSGGRTDDTNLTVKVTLPTTGTLAVAGDKIQLYNSSTALGSAYTLLSGDITNGFANVATGTLTNGTSYTINAKVIDIAGNASGGSGNFSVTVDTTAPTVTISDNVAGTATGATTFTFTFSEAVTGFDTSKVTVGNGTKGTFSGSGTTYTLVVTPTASSAGNITVDVSTTGMTDAAGNLATAPAQYTQAFDTAAPTVTITDNVTGTANLATTNIAYTYTFSETVTGLAADDFTVTNGAISSVVAGSGTTWTVNVTPNTGVASGQVTLLLAASAVTDAAGNPNASSNTNSSQAIDTVAPSIASSGTPTANENIGADQTVYTVVATDTNSITYSLKANTGDVADFSINGDTGAVTLTGNPNFETKPSYSFTIVATDAAGNFSEQAVSLTINNVNEAPVITSATTASFAENGTGTVYTVTATDVDASTTLTYSLSGDDAALFNITDGAVTFKNAPNFESPTDSGLNNVYDINVIASDGALNTTQAVAITVTNVNEAPTAVTLTNQQTAIAENTSTATRIKVADIAITDDALGTNNLSVSGTDATDASFFEIDATGLYVKANTVLNYEAKTSYNVTVNVDDSTVGSTPDATTNFTLNVTNVNEAPTAVSLNNQVTAIAENTSTTNRIKVADVAIADDALGTNNLSVSGTDASFFEISGNILYLKANTALNFEAKTSYSVNVNVDDSTVGNTPDATTNFILTVTDVNEAPTAVSLNNQVIAIAENTSTTNRIKVADIAITDDALGTNNLSVSGTDASVFEVVGTELYIKANTALNFEAKTSYNVTVNADDSTVGSTPDATTNFTLNVTNVNEAPVITSAATATFAENGTSTVYTVTATDPDAGTTLTYSLSGTDAALFNITNGAVTFKNAPNFESRTDGNSDNVYDINVIASDGALNTTKAVAITVTNVNEAPTVANAIANQTIAVNASFNYTFDANTFSDVDSDPLTYTVTLANGTALPSWLTFNATTRTFSGTPTTPGNLDIKIVANDSNGGTIADEFQLSIVTPIVGTATNDSVYAISTAEIIDGAGGIDEVNYARSNSGVTIDLETGKGIGGYAQGDILTNIEKLTGSSYNDHFKGNAAYNYFYGGNGNDLLEAGSGGGFFYGENGNDTIYGGEGQDRLYGQTGNDLLDGKGGNDILLGGNDQDSLFGGAGNDILYGDDGNDELTGTNSTAKGIGEIDILYGGAGSDIFILGNATNIFYDDGNPLNMGKTDYARIKDYNQAQDIIKLTNGKSYYLGVSPGGIVSGTSIFIDNDGIGGLTSKDELIANLEGTNLTLGLITGSTQGFSFV